MIQRFIELGEGYSDIYELIELAKTNRHRLAHFLSMRAIKNDRQVTSLVVILHPTEQGDFQPLYICREGIPDPEHTPNKRYEMFAQTAQELGKEIISLEVKSSSFFNELELYYQYLIGVLRMNRYIPPLQYGAY